MIDRLFGKTTGVPKFESFVCGVGLDGVESADGVRGER